MAFDPRYCTYYTDILANLNSHQLRVALHAALTQPISLCTVEPLLKATPDLRTPPL